MMNNKIENNATVNKEEQFYADLGKLIAKYYFNESLFNKLTFFVKPEEINKENKKVEPEIKTLTKAKKLKEYGKKGFEIKNVNQTRPSTDSVCVVGKIVAEFSDKVTMKDVNRTGAKNGYFNCPKAAATIIERYDDDGQIVRDAIDIMIKAGYHERENGITADKLELVTRILALHQRRGRAKAKEALIALLKSQTMNSLLVLAKETKLYHQRNAIDMRVLYVESELAKIDGIRNQFTR